LVSGYLRRRYDKAREMVLDELRAGRLDGYEAASEDDAIAITLRIMRAAHEGAARLNLRLLAKAVAGQAQRGALVADEFHLHADRLASLSRDEIILIATLYKYLRAGEDHRARNPGSSGGDPWELTKQELDRNVFKKDGYAMAVAAQAQRSGLVAGSTAFSAMAYQLTPIMLELSKLVDFHDALRREGIRV
jgi:hypothetical protein